MPAILNFAFIENEEIRYIKIEELNLHQFLRSLTRRNNRDYTYDIIYVSSVPVVRIYENGNLLLNNVAKQLVLSMLNFRQGNT